MVHSDDLDVLLYVMKATSDSDQVAKMQESIEHAQLMLFLLLTNAAPSQRV